MKIALIGYGKMGQAIEPIALERGHEIVLRAKSETDVDRAIVAGADVAIEFSNPDSAVKNISLCFEENTPVVVGTTGWYDSLGQIKEKMATTGGAILPATNFSLGVNIYLEINKKLAELMNNQKQYNILIEETHHTQKLDAPSGTAITIGEGILDAIDRKSQWKLDKSESDQDLEIKAYRTEGVPGTHVVSYRSEVDTIKLEHIAHSRKGFALGAVIAAEFLQGKQGLYSMKDVLKLN